MPIDKLLKSTNTSAALSGALGGAAGGALVSAFTNKKSARNLLKAGGLVALGGVAWRAYQKYQSREQPADQPSVPQITEAEFVVHEPASNTDTLILKAMIAAGYADGHLSELERRRIWQRALDEKLPTDALADLQAMLDTPITIQALAASAPDLKLRIELYTASRLVIDAECIAGTQHLQQLAAAMEIPPGLVAALEENAERES